MLPEAIGLLVDILNEMEDSSITRSEEWVNVVFDNDDPFLGPC